MDISPGPDYEQDQQPEGPRLRSWLLGALIAGVLLFIVFFTWYHNTSNLDQAPSNGNDSPFSFSGSD